MLQRGTTAIVPYSEDKDPYGLNRDSIHFASYFYRMMCYI